LLILTGPPGAGKTTVATRVAEHFTPSVVLEADALWAHVVRGFVEPWEEESDPQNRALVRASLAAAARLTSSGYATVLSGHVGPWFMDLVDSELAEVRAPVVYVVLRPTLEDCLARCVTRQLEPRHAGALNDEQVIRQMFRWYSNLERFERHGLDIHGLTMDETTSLVVNELESPRFALG
jgi:deoxyadenosine/deoxycytidine kinase